MSSLNEAYESGVLDPAVHSRLVANLESYARRANIQDTAILSKMSQFHCTADEINYVKSIRRAATAGHFGLVYQGKESTSILARMSAVAGACLRNFIDARVMTLQELLAAIKDTDIPQARVLLVPNFFIERVEGGRIADWHIAELLGVLYSRMAKGQQTFLYVSNFEALRKAYGEPVALHLQQNFQAITA